ncbi:DNA primase [Bacteroidia bacterium]|nr:DNA primase [Bacteroidia bacterium]GHT47612.1 DNA primase [Bacteroidia bacterium]
MTLPEIKQISIREYFNNVGIHPTKEYGYYGLYHCPYREDQNASFKVDYNKNVWHDFGTGEGGSIIDLVMKMGNCSFNEAVRQLDNNTVKHTNDCIYQHHNIGTSQRCNADDFSFHRNEITSIQPISHLKLIQWVKERKIDLSLANLYCREVHYQNQSGNHFSIGFRNDNGGYELSSPNNFKGCIAPKDITTIQNNSNACLVFEGFWDFLSYLTLQKVEKSKHDVAILNSVANVQKAMDFLKTHKEIYTYLDNDDAGHKATELIQSAHSTVYNRSTKYAEYKDLNDYLCGKKQVLEKVKKRRLKL